MSTRTVIRACELSEFLASMQCIPAWAHAEMSILDTLLTHQYRPRELRTAQGYAMGNLCRIGRARRAAS